MMFTIDQIKAAHSKVRSGADFPPYIQDLIGLGVRSYETFVSDSHADYVGENGYQVSSAAKYEPLTIAGTSNVAQFKIDLKEHQQGKTDYFTFCKMSAQMGVEKWAVSMADMTCTYYDKAGNALLVEVIPQP